MHHEKRQPFLVDRTQEFENSLSAIANHFNLRWLEQKGTHPIQILWNRQDYLASSELFIFGTALNKMGSININWTINHVNNIKNGQLNNRNGSLFEIICLGMFTPHLNVSPSRSNQAGYDGIVELSASKKIRLSIKRFSYSSHYKDFHFHCEEIENLYKSVCRNNTIHTSQLFASFTSFPNNANWKILTAELTTLAKIYKGSYIDFESDELYIGIAPLEGKRPFSLSNHSYHSIILSPLHKNERLNLFSKLDEAYNNLNEHGGKENDEFINLVCIHLDANASAGECIKWTYEYFDEYPEKCISGIFFYQPLVARNLETGAPFINHFVIGAMNGNRYNQWNTSGNDIRFDVPIGTLNDKPASQKIVTIKNGVKKVADVGESYFYQRGHYYYLNSFKGTSVEASLNLDNPAPGVIEHSVISFGKAEMLLTPKSAPTDELLII